MDRHLGVCSFYVDVTRTRTDAACLCSQVGLRLNQDKDHSKGTVEAVCRSTPGSFFGLSGLRTDAYRAAGDAELSKASVLRQLYSFENFTRCVCLPD